MARILGVLSFGDWGNSVSQISGFLFLLCLVSASISMILLACSHRPKRSSRSQNVVYYGHGGTANSSTSQGNGRGGAADFTASTGLGVAAGLAIAVSLDAGGVSCGGGGCGGGCGG